MSSVRRIDLGLPALLAFRGPDAVRYLNGQVTQDVRRVAKEKIPLHACVTDAKGKLQFRVMLTAADDEGLWVSCHPASADALHARLTKYLIADDVDVTDLTGTVALSHFTGPVSEPSEGVMARPANRFGTPGTDWWIPAAGPFAWPENVRLLENEELECLRITNGIPAWGHELVEGMLPQEALLDETDISYDKGCYIGQEVISRIKFAGKLNRRLTSFVLEPGFPNAPFPLIDAEGAAAGEITSISPLGSGECRDALGFLKRGVTETFYRSGDGPLVSVRTR